MTYATLDHLIERAGIEEIKETADRNADGAIDREWVAAALIHADNIINGYVRARYPDPFVQVPDLLRTWAVSIARYKLHRYSPPEYVETDYKDAISSLKDVAAGKITLPMPDGATPDDPSGQHMSWSPAEVFSEKNMRGWR